MIDPFWEPKKFFGTPPVDLKEFIMPGSAFRVRVDANIPEDTVVIMNGLDPVAVIYNIGTAAQDKGTLPVHLL